MLSSVHAEKKHCAVQSTCCIVAASLASRTSMRRYAQNWLLILGPDMSRWECKWRELEHEAGCTTLWVLPVLYRFL